MRTLGCLVKGCLSGIGVLLLTFILLMLWAVVDYHIGAPLVAPPTLAVTGQLAFMTNIPLTPTIGLINADGTSPITLTTEWTTDLIWSPDGRTLAFSTGSTLVLLAVNEGDHPTLFAQDGTVASLVWSPDGSHIVFEVDDEPYHPNLSVINVDGSGLQRLTDDPSDDRSPTWSPDGSHIAFVSNRSGQNQLYTIRRDGTDLRRLTHEGADYTPAWSPTGNVIAFQRYENIYCIAPDGSQLTQLTHTGRDLIPVWSPDGSQLAFTRDPGFSINPDTVETSLYRMNADGSKETKLTNWEVVVFSVPFPTWSPDGSALAFLGRPPHRSYDAEEEALYVVRADGTAMARVRKTGDSFGLAWRPPTPTPAR